MQDFNESEFRDWLLKLRFTANVLGRFDDIIEEYGEDFWLKYFDAGMTPYDACMQDFSGQI